MKISHLLKPRFASILITLLISLQMSACSTEDISTATTLPPVVGHAASISGVNSASVTEDIDPDGDNLLEAGGKLNITDSDAGEAVFVATPANGTYCPLTTHTACN